MKIRKLKASIHGEIPLVNYIIFRLSVWSNGLLLEYIDGTKKTESAFFPISTLHYCAAVRYVNVSGFSIEGGGERFIPLDTPFAHIPDSPHPPIFAPIFRRTTGVKVLECHAFICTNEKAANALVNCCFRAYSDTMYLKIGDKYGTEIKAIKDQQSRSASPSSELNMSEQENGTDENRGEDQRSWNERAIGQKTWQRRQQNGEYDVASISSSFFNKKSKKNSTLKREGALQPYMENRQGFMQRRGSHSDLRYGADSHPANYYYDSNNNGNFYDRGTPLIPPPPHFRGMPPPPPPFMPPHGVFPPGRPGMPPPFFGMPMYGPAHMHGPPHRMHPPRGPPGKFGTGMPVPPMNYYPYGPHMMGGPPQRFMPFFMPYGGPPFPPHLMMDPRNRSKPGSSDGPTSGPIITESIYDTFPRRTTYEEPIYMPSNSGVPVPPHSSYKPGSMSPEHYEGYYESYRHRTPKKNTENESDGSAEDSNAQIWEAYEAGIYRKAHINEKAFANTVVNSKQQSHHGNESSYTSELEQQNSSTAAIPGTSGTANGRPHTPPKDYDFESPPKHTTTTANINTSTPLQHNSSSAGSQRPAAAAY